MFVLAGACALWPALAPAQRPNASPSGFTLSPYALIAKPSTIESDVRLRTDFGDFDANLEFEPGTVLGFGIAAAKSFGGAWSLFGELSRGGSDADVHVCGDGGCDDVGVDVSMWNVTVGAGRRLAFTPFQTGALHLVIGGTVNHMEFDIPDQSEDVSTLNPGIVAGLVMSVPIATMVDVRFHITDAILKLDGGFEDDLDKSFESPGIEATSDAKSSFVNLLTLGFGLSFRF